MVRKEERCVGKELGHFLFPSTNVVPPKAINLRMIDATTFVVFLNIFIYAFH